MIDLPDTRKDLFLLEDGITYLNCANMSPMLKAVKEAGLKALEIRAAPWKLSSEDWFTNAEILRGLAARIFQTDDNSIALIPSASYGIAVAAKNLKPKEGKEIIILEQQFPSNYYAWEQLARERHLKIVTVQRDKRKKLTDRIVETITANTGIVAIPNCHWIDGTWIDLQKVSDAAKAVGSYLVLDLSQSLGALPIDIDRIQPDFAVSVGYKWLLGPYSLGYLYASKQWQEMGEPLEYSWLIKKGSDDFSALTNYATEYRTGATRFDMGEYPQLNSLPMAIAALEQILRWEVNSIQTELKKLTDKIAEYKNKMGLSVSSDTSAGHLTSIPLDPAKVNVLKDRLQENKVIISFRGASIRVSPYLYNDAGDVDKLLSCLY
jgi:selenocysteine lyase/cysteine desulfurase